MERQRKSQRGSWRGGRPARLLVAVLAVFALALMLGWGHQSSQQAEANDSTVDFAISGPTTVPVNETFKATVSLVSAGAVSGSVSHWQAAISWTTGLTGPGDPGSTKGLSINNCPNGGVTAAPFDPLGPAQTAAAACTAFPPPFSVVEETAITASFEFTCGATPSSETVTMVVTAGAKQNATHLDDGAVVHAELSGSEALEILCVPPPTPDPCPDVDGDTLCEDVDLDDDSDGCTDLAELQPKSEAATGGGRDPLVYWDFNDMWVNKQKDRRVNIIDIGAIVNRFGAQGDPGGDPLDPPQNLNGYHVSADRSPPAIGANLWNAGPPDGLINIIEVGTTIVQFGHDCSGPLATPTPTSTPCPPEGCPTATTTPTPGSINLSIGIPGVCDTLSGNGKCDLAPDASFTLDMNVADVQPVSVLANGYDGVQMVISWEGAVEGPKPTNANTLTITSTDPNCEIPILVLEPGLRVDHAAVVCAGFSPLTMGTAGFKNANLGQAEFDCLSPGVGTITLLHGAATNDSFVNNLGLPHEEIDPNDVLTINCGPPPPTDTPTPTSTPTQTPTSTSTPIPTPTDAPVPTDTPTITPTPTDTPTPTPGACPDFDADTLCDDVDPDDDNDGCTDVAELEPKSEAATGGGRDPLYYWDFMDMWVDKEKDRRVNIIDIGAIVPRFGSTGDPGGDPLDPPQALAGYHVSADRSPPEEGANLWNAGPPDGNINIIEIGLIVVQFGHNCSGQA